MEKCYDCNEETNKVCQECGYLYCGCGKTIELCELCQQKDDELEEFLSS